MNAILQALDDALRPGSFVAGQRVSAKHLQITVRGFPSKTGRLRWPLSARAARALIGLARPARFGWKDQTLLDSSVRDVWEIPASRLKVHKPSWNAALAPALAKLQTRLGLPPDCTLKAQLHNLLVYEPGQFFSPHQDSEKLDGMVATLVVVLPSHYRGGALVIAHQGEEKRFQAPRAAGDKLGLIAFYADCQHEVKPVTEGHRVTLTFNLVVQGSDGPPRMPEGSGEAIERLTQAMKGYFRPPAADADERAETMPARKEKQPKKWIYLLDHQYTRKGLLWRHLKNADRARARVLKDLTDALKLEIHLVLADVREIWDCEEEDAWDYRGRRWYWDEDDDDMDDELAEEEPGAADNLILHEIIDNEIVLRHWVDSKGRLMKYRDLSVFGDEAFWTRASKEFSPFESEYEGFTGNAGNTLERWYHRAAIVLWQREDNDAVLCELEPERVIREILNEARRDTNREQARNRLRHLLPYWSGAPRGRLTNSVFSLALEVRDAELASALLLPLGLQVLTPETAKRLAQMEAIYGSPWCLQLLNAWRPAVEQVYDPAACLMERLPRIVQALLRTDGRKSGPGAWLLEYQYATLKKATEEFQRHASSTELTAQEPDQLRLAFELLAAARLAGETALHRQVMNYLKNNPMLYSTAGLAAMLPAVRKSLAGGDFQSWGFEDLLGTLRDRLNKRLAHGARDKDDWSIAPLHACDCADCQQLNQFLRSRRKTEWVWPLKKERRRHIHFQIDRAGLPLTHLTRRTGSPHQLILTKTTEIFQQDRKELEAAKLALAGLRGR